MFRKCKELFSIMFGETYAKHLLVRPRRRWQNVVMVVKTKYKAIPLHPQTGSEGSRRPRLPDFKTIGT
jgi:hypothetical protein